MPSEASTCTRVLAQPATRTVATGRLAPQTARHVPAKENADAATGFADIESVSGVTGAAAMTGAAVAWWLWPDVEAEVVPSVSGRGDDALPIRISR